MNALLNPGERALAKHGIVFKGRVRNKCIRTIRIRYLGLMALTPAIMSVYAEHANTT